MKYRWAGAAVAAAIVAAVIVGRDEPLVVDAVTSAQADFSGRWKLFEQETTAPGGKGLLGNHEEPVSIVQSADRLALKVESADTAGRFEYDVTGRTLQTTGPAGEKVKVTSTWEGRTLVTKGRRLFTSPAGAALHSFEERRFLSPDGQRMTVETRIDLFLEDVHRKSVYVRLPLL